MRILFLTAEMAPFAKAGGLADVAAALPAALAREGHDVRVVMPRYGTIDPARWDLESLGAPFRFPAGHETIQASLSHVEHDGVPVCFVEIPWLFGDRPRMYDFGDDGRRFVLFTAAALAGMERLDWCPDVIHANDWHAALAPAMLRGGRAGAFYVDTASVLTIHNLAYQGWTERASLDGAAALLPQWVHENWINLLALGLGTTDAITTVSPTYAHEILTAEYGEGLDGLLRSRSDRLWGVLNGLDSQQFDPGADPRIPAPFSASDLSGKAECKAALQEEAGLPVDPRRPLLAMVTRLVDQKGLDLVAGGLETLLHEAPLQVAVLGSGQPQYEGYFAGLADRYPDRVKAWIGFDAALAQRVYAGADMFLMPSRFEPCGLGQMIAMRYGTVPIVRATGGLADTVHEGPAGDPRTGFVFWEYQVPALQNAVRRALGAYARPDEWTAIMRNGMAVDNSWEHAAETYDGIYTRALHLRRGPTP